MQANTLVKVVKVYDPANDWAVGRYGVVQSVKSMGSNPHGDAVTVLISRDNEVHTFVFSADQLEELVKR